MEKCSCPHTAHAGLISGKVTRDYECLVPEEPHVHMVCLDNFKMTKLWELKKLLIEKDKKSIGVYVTTFRKL